MRLVNPYQPKLIPKVAVISPYQPVLTPKIIIVPLNALAKRLLTSPYQA